MIMRSSCASANKSEIIKDCKNTIMTAQNVLSAEDKQMGLIHRAPSPHQLAWREWIDMPALDKTSGTFADHMF